MNKGLIISAFIAFWLTGKAQDQAEYILQYQDLAVSEMLRTGIPASIKLAQAMLESNCGKSELACKANNHFGIKCGTEWGGKSFHKEDDDYSNGKLIKSCFREFNSVMDSYVAHSDFLMDPAKASRYGSLFQIKITDYKSWAQGLSKAGYATDPQYAKRLIDLIEKYELFRFDNENESQWASASIPTSQLDAFIRYNNNVKYAVAVAGDNPILLAKRYDVKVNQLLRFNEDITTKTQALTEGSKVYLEPKRSSYHGKKKYHMLKLGEDMIAVSQLYGIKLDALLKKNGLEKNEIPLPNQKIMLKSRAKQELKKVGPYKMPEEKKSIPPAKATTDDSVTSTTKQPVSSKASTGNSVKIASASKITPDPSHIVAKGDTLYRIANTYGLSVEELKKRNNLSADTIFVGQKLVIQ